MNKRGLINGMKNNARLYELLKKGMKNISLSFLKDMKMDSRITSKGDLFIAIPGDRTDGRYYINEAIKNGVAVILAEADNPLQDGKITIQNGTPIIYVNQLKLHLSDLAGQFYNHPSHFMHLIGITGTNGKTTTTYLIAQWASLLNESSTILGTIGNGLLYDTQPSTHTTESAIDIQRLLATFIKKYQTTLCAMEVSSHGLVQNRVNGLRFAVALFLNLSHDHLDYHGNMKKYELAKRKLFDNLDVKERIFNIDDPIGKKWLISFPNAIAVTTKQNLLPKSWKGKWLKMSKIDYYNYSANINFQSSWGSGRIHSKLIGEFNYSNLLMALATLLTLGYPLQLLLETANQLKLAYGRMEIFHTNESPLIIIDYAHTPDALEKVLKAATIYCRGKLWCIFGCGGDRDKAKRPFMGKIAEKYSDKVIITSDNSRSESLYDISKDIQSGLKRRISPLDVIPSRKQAITSVINKANTIDVIVIAGKGHEEYQIIGNNYIPHSDRLLVSQLLGIV
nr:UDP-N-acetylmuramoyl-L-alanyl-D-glutamate--2,6-diaminopimelate ligase [Candidatus Schneideria nysicola]